MEVNASEGSVSQETSNGVIQFPVFFSKINIDQSTNDHELIAVY